MNIFTTEDMQAIDAAVEARPDLNEWVVRIRQLHALFPRMSTEDKIKSIDILSEHLEVLPSAVQTTLKAIAALKHVKTEKQFRAWVRAHADLHRRVVSCMATKGREN